MDESKLLELAIGACLSLGVEYADARVETIEDENISISSGIIKPIEHTTSRGIGIRVLKKGCWGFAATDRPDERSIRAKAALAVEMAEAASTVNRNRVVLAPVDIIKAKYTSAYRIDPFTIPLDQKIDFLRDIDQAAVNAGGDKIDSREIFASFRRRNKYFASLDGAAISQLLIHTGAGLSLGKLVSRHDSFERSYPSSSGQYECKGYELLEELKMQEAIPRLIEEIEMLKTAEPCPETTTTLLLSGDQVSLQIHESIGHALELDRVFGVERDFSGTSFATTDNLGKLKYASDIVTVVCDSTVPHGLASYGYDDEGVPTKQVDLIRNGILVNYLSSRETATRIGKESTAAMRANSWANVPIVRIANVNLLPGNKSFEQLLSEIDDGIYMDTVKSWSIDDERRYFQFGCEFGRLIKGGKLAGAIKNPTYSGCTLDFWNKCTGIADEHAYRIWGTPNCGKGQPGQNARTAQGASPARFDQIAVGGGQ